MRTLLATAILVSLAACSDNSVAYSNIDTEVAQAFCDYVERCPAGDYGSAILRLAVQNSPSGSCVDLVLATGGLDLSQFDASIRAGRIHYDGDAARACLDAISKECRGFDAFDSDPCSRVFTGRVALGGNCSMDEECKGDAYCEDSPTANVCLGVCTAAAEVGQPCGGSSPDCDPNVPGGTLFCDTTTANPNDHCILVHSTQVGPGQACGDVVADGDDQTVASCTQGYYCRITVGQVGTCTAPIALLNSCIPTVDVCEGNALCQPGSNQCVPIVIQNQASTVCEPLGPDFCNPLSRLECVSNVCQLIGTGAIGANCRTSFPTDCNDGLYCDPANDSCASPLGNGSPCDPNANGQCISGYCDEVTDPLNPVCSDRPVCN